MIFRWLPFIFLLFSNIAVVSATRIYVKDHVIQGGSLTNIHIDWEETSINPMDRNVTVSFCPFNQDDSFERNHTVIGTIQSSVSITKLVWEVPSYNGVAVNLYAALGSQDNVVAESDKYTISTSAKIDAGVFLDGVKYYKSLRKDTILADSKDISIGIIGAGASGLFSAYLLGSVGFTNYEIIEGSDRVGGRIYTAYFDSPSDIAYQELGAMRIPATWSYKNQTVPVGESQVVFQLVEELNQQNAAQHKIEFIRWIDSTENNFLYFNDFRLPNGQVPTNGDLPGMNIIHPPGSPEELYREASKGIATLLSDDLLDLIGTIPFEAFNKVLKDFADWTPWDWFHNKIGISSNATEYLHDIALRKDIWDLMHELFTFSKTNDWRTIQGGMSRLPRAFVPLLGKKITFGTKVTKLDFEENLISVQWKSKPSDRAYQKRNFDKVIVSVPFSVVRSWHLPKDLPYTLGRAIKHLGYDSLCKLALKFNTRFWEKAEKPIFGGCGQTDTILGIGPCYPSNNINSSGVGVMLASYAHERVESFAVMSDEEYVQESLAALAVLHGDIIYEQYTGEYARQCWNNDPFFAAGLATPLAGQHKLFTSSYLEYNKGLIFVGEHTHISHKWISSALHSAIRGVVMTLIEGGHIDEAKEIIYHWNSTEIHL